MLQTYHQLISDITRLTGAAPPGLVDDDSPALAPAAIEADSELYLIGLIGGKDVGKSALVNAIVGREITPGSSHGPGTETAIAYVHESQAAALERLLDRHIPGQYRIVTHDLPELVRQALVDLPDIDSHYASHVEVTRRMLRHMLFPIWIQSVEKYADHRPRELLRLVSEGNDPRNFIFCLNKADQIFAREGQAAADELREDFAGRIAECLGLAEPPRVYLISAIHPEQFDLPTLRLLLSREKTHRQLESSRQQALMRQGLFLDRWIQRQDLPQRLEGLQRLQAAAEDEVAARIAIPLVERAIPRILDDPAHRLALADQLMTKRIARWPIVNILHVLLSPLLSVVRRRLPVAQQLGLESPDTLVEQHLNAFSAGRSLPTLIQSTFAGLHQSSPQLAGLYADQRLWEEAPADAAADALRQRLADTIERQRESIRQQRGGAGPVGAFFRILLTIGAVLWFPIVQPLLEIALAGPSIGVRRLILLGVELLGATYLLKSIGFLVVYFTILWLIIKWDTQRKVDRCLVRWKSPPAGRPADRSLSLPAQVLEWCDTLVGPLKTARGSLEGLIRRADELRESIRKAA